MPAPVLAVQIGECSQIGILMSAVWTRKRAPSSEVLHSLLIVPLLSCRQLCASAPVLPEQNFPISALQASDSRVRPPRPPALRPAAGPPAASSAAGAAPRVP